MINKTITNLIIMFICLCHAVTDKEINQAIIEGAGTVDALMSELKVATQCGGCLNEVADMVDKHQKVSPVAMPCNNYQQVEIYRP